MPFLLLVVPYYGTGFRCILFNALLSSLLSLFGNFIARLEEVFLCVHPICGHAQSAFPLATRGMLLFVVERVFGALRPGKTETGLLTYRAFSHGLAQLLHFLQISLSNFHMTL